MCCCLLYILPTTSLSALRSGSFDSSPANPYCPTPPFYRSRIIKRDTRFKLNSLWSQCPQKWTIHFSLPALGSFAIAHTGFQRDGRSSSGQSAICPGRDPINIIRLDRWVGRTCGKNQPLTDYLRMLSRL